jgi:hypothetical protein
MTVASSQNPLVAGMARRTQRLIALGVVLLLAAAAVGAMVPIAFGVPRAKVQLTWGEIDPAERRRLESQFNLSEATALDGRTWAYVPLDVTADSLGAIVEHRSVTATAGIDRSTFRLSRAPLTERRGGFLPGAPRWVVRATILAAWLMAALGSVVLACGAASARGVGLDEVKRFARLLRDDFPGTIRRALRAVSFSHAPTRALVHAVAVSLFAITSLIRFLAIGGFPNDHFLYLAPAQQMLAGEWPSKDFVDPGSPLMYAVSAIARLVVDSPLLAEALVVSTAFGLGAALMIYAGLLASGSLRIAVMVTIAEIAMFPRSYHYPKLTLYAAGVLAMWAYARTPTLGRAVVLAASVVVAFLFRHDHGLFLGIAALLTAAFAKSGTGGIRRVGQMAVLIGLLVLPYLLYVEATIGLAQHLASGIAYSRAEAARTMLPLPLFNVSSWGSADNALSALFYTFHLLPMIALAMLAWGRITGTALGVSEEWRRILPLAVFAMIVNTALLRDPLVYRLADVAVPACILVAWLVPRLWRGTETGRIAGRGLVLATATVFLLGVNVVGSPSEKLNRAGLLLGPAGLVAHAQARVVELQAQASPRQFPNRLIRALVPFFQYTDRCTTAEQRLFVAGEAPEVYVFARRLFAGGQPALRSGFFRTPADQRRLVSRLREQQVPLALVLPEGDAERFPLVMDELRRAFRPVLEIPVDGQANVLVLASRHIRPSSVDVATGLPCFM